MGKLKFALRATQMHRLGYKQFSRRHLPHIHPPDSTLFVTYRLAGSIPQAVLRHYKRKNELLQEELLRKRKSAMYDKLQLVDSAEIQTQVEQFERFHRAWFLKFEETLDQARTGPTWLKDNKVAAVVAGQLHALDDEAYKLDAYCVMSNHVHVVFMPFLSGASLYEDVDETGHLAFTGEYPGLSQIMHRLKGPSAREANLTLSRTGQFWEHESFDHVIRPGKLMRTVKYVLENPVKAGLVKDWREWRWSYCRKELYDKL
jgi:REP element-mobilizing transposase RayT